MSGEKVVIGNAELWHGDCREILPEIAQADLLLTDPPYGIGFAAQPTKWQRRNSAAPESWDDCTISEGLLKLIQEKGKNLIIWGGNYYPLPVSRCWLAWTKPDSPPSMGDVELAWTNMDMTAKAISHSISATNKERVGHPTQKPVRVMEWCISLVPQSASVCDPFMGSGTTGVACWNLEKRFAGIEKNEKYFWLACERIDAAQAQQKLAL